jgi:hypothetical protein
MKYILQISTGGFQHKAADFNVIKERLEYCFERIMVKAIFIGWAIDRDLYKKVCQYVNGRCDVILWLPVFSEVNDVYEFDPSTDFRGNSMKPIHIAAGENFMFVCPSSQDNIDKVYQLYNEYFSGCGFDGVFLDKIRFASFANSYENGFGCFCPRCRDYYSYECVDIDLCIDILNRHEAESFLPSAFTGCRYSFENETINRLFTARAKLITSRVETLIQRFKRLGLKAGLDTVAPIVSWFVGQDIIELSEFADFIKPMIYRISREPAGISYEIKHLVEKLGSDNAGILEKRIHDLIGSDDPTGPIVYSKQLAMLRDARCGIYPGIEFNKKAGCDSNMDYIRDTVRLSADNNYDTIVLAWDVLSAPLDHIDCLSG